MTEPDEDVLTEEVLNAVVAMTPVRVLRRLAEAADRGGGAAVRVHLISGQVLVGRLIGVDTDQGHEVAVLYDPRTGSLGYALTLHVVGVEVADPGMVRDVVSADRMPADAGS